MKKLTIQELETNNSNSVYVLSNLYNTGDVNILVTTKEGRSLHCSIPSTKVQIPFNLTDFFPKEDIINSTEFRALVQKSVLTIISDDYAKELLNNPKIIKELEDLNKAKTDMIANYSNKKDNVDFSTDYEDEDFLVQLDRDDINYKTKAELFKKNKGSLTLKQLKALKNKYNEKVNGKVNLLYKAIKEAIQEKE